MKKTRLWIIIAVVVIIAVLFVVVRRTSQSGTARLEAAAVQGTFVITITTTGDLEAKNSENISGPSVMGLREARLWELTIDDIIADGTVVDSGQYVARLSRSELTNRIKDKEIEVETAQNNLITTQLDTALSLRSSRDELINLEYNVEERQIAVDQSMYEPPATQRQANIDLEKAQRALRQSQENYNLKLEQAVVKMSEVQTSLRKKQGELANLYELNKEFTIFAPRSGMVVHKRDYSGKKIGIGATVNIWDNVVATLPDLRSMVIKTYVNEIDISKVKIGQKVDIGVDAFPKNRYTGYVYYVANIGEQMSNSNSKAFEVMIQVNEYDSILRPAMTTKNSIITAEIPDVVYIPLEGIFGTDSLQYVFTGGVRRQVLVGASNDNEIIIKEGLKAGEKVLLSQPENHENYRLVTLPEELVNAYREEKKREQMEQEQRKKEQQQQQPAGTIKIGNSGVTLRLGQTQ